jgi:hypothetical protein
MFPVEWGGAATGALGMSPRGRIYNLTITDQVDVEIVDANIEVRAGQGAVANIPLCVGPKAERLRASDNFSKQFPYLRSRSTQRLFTLGRGTEDPPARAAGLAKSEAWGRLFHKGAAP